jgi:hypothetical protein
MAADLGYLCFSQSGVCSGNDFSGSVVKKPQAIDKSRTGNTTKIHWVVNGYGLPVEF